MGKKIHKKDNELNKVQHRLALQDSLNDKASQVKCVAVCCSLLQSVAVCCIVWQDSLNNKASQVKCVAVCCSVLWCVAVSCIV
jgi:hypothetical protein